LKNLVLGKFGLFKAVYSKMNLLFLSHSDLISRYLYFEVELIVKGKSIQNIFSSKREGNSAYIYIVKLGAEGCE